MNGIDTILRRLDTDAKAEADAVLKKARQEAADITARYQAQAAQEAARLAGYDRAIVTNVSRVISTPSNCSRRTKSTCLIFFRFRIARIFAPMLISCLIFCSIQSSKSNQFRSILALFYGARIYKRCSFQSILN